LIRREARKTGENSRDIFLSDGGNRWSLHRLHGPAKIRTVEVLSIRQIGDLTTLEIINFQTMDSLIQ